ncbi:MAG: hypothetical protein WD200_05085 [Candidatus Andersenbacteria bacterium]
MMETEAGKGFLISFDGLDSSGKETQARLFIERLERAGKTVRQFQTPDYETESGKELKLRLQGRLGNWEETSWEEKLMYFARNRAEHRQEVIEALKRGEVVVYDRYVPSSLAFIAVEAMHDASSVSREEVHQAVRNVEYEKNGMPREDISIFLDVPPSITTALLEKRKEKLRDDDEYTDHIHVQERLYAEYQYLAQSNPQYVSIPCTQGENLLPIEEIHQLIWGRITQTLPRIFA